MDTTTEIAVSTGNSIPFEDPSLPFLARLFETIKAVLTDPIRTFSGMESGELGRPMTYGTIVGTFGIVGAVLWQFAFVAIMSIMSITQEGWEVALLIGGFLTLFVVMSPLLVLFGLFMNAGIYHLMLMLMGGAERGFPITFRAVAYGQTPAILMFIPFCGSWIGGIWTTVLVIMGAIYGHATDGWRGVLAYFLPMILGCVLVFCVLFTFGIIGGLIGGLAAATQ